MRLLKAIFFFTVITMVVFGCGEEMIDPPGPDPTDLTSIAYNPEPYTVELPNRFPELESPDFNPLTKDGVELGRRLFYDPILSVDSTISCASCHLQNGSFTDNLKVSPGVNGKMGRRSSMSLLNVGLYYNGLFWDGRVAGLEEQALHPIEDPAEMQNTWENVESKLKVHNNYPGLFRKAFGIENTSEINRDLVTRALAQFERIIVSSGNSKFDRVSDGLDVFTDKELDGFDMFFDLNPNLPDAECAHCHNAPLFTVNEYINNGLDYVASLDDFMDLGRGEVTNNRIDNGAFRVPTLRNAVYSAPYMHDGRFETLEEVIEHYNSGGFQVDNTNPLIRPLGLTEYQKEALLAFILTLSDNSTNENPELSNPFE